MIKFLRLGRRQGDNVMMVRLELNRKEEPKIDKKAKAKTKPKLINRKKVKK